MKVKTFLFALFFFITSLSYGQNYLADQGEGGGHIQGFYSFYKEGNGYGGNIGFTSKKGFSGYLSLSQVNLKSTNTITDASLFGLLGSQSFSKSTGFAFLTLDFGLQLFLPTAPENSIALVVPLGFNLFFDICPQEKFSYLINPFVSASIIGTRDVDVVYGLAGILELDFANITTAIGFGEQSTIFTLGAGYFFRSKKPVEASDSKN